MRRQTNTSRKQVACARSTDSGGACHGGACLFGVYDVVLPLVTEMLEGYGIVFKWVVVMSCLWLRLRRTTVREFEESCKRSEVTGELMADLADDDVEADATALTLQRWNADGAVLL